MVFIGSLDTPSQIVVAAVSGSFLAALLIVGGILIISALSEWRRKHRKRRTQ